MSDDAFARAIEAMTDVQRRSAEAAGALVKRLIASVDGAVDAAPEPTDADRPGPPSDVDDAIAGFAKLWRDSVTSLASAMSGAPPTSNVARMDTNAVGSTSALRIELDPVTSAGTAEMWLHNPTAEPLDKLRLHWSAPVAHDGSTLDVLSIVADPDAFDLPPRSSRGVEISVTAIGARSGTYRTIVLVDGLADQWLPVEIVVTEPSQ